MTKRSDTSLKQFLIFLLFLMNVQTIAAGEVRLNGKAPMYAGESITFYTYSDYITKDTIHLATARIDDNGNFKCKFNLEQVNKIFVNMGVYKGYLYVEPGKNYELALPDKKEKDKTQKLNPFFEGIPIHIGIKNTNKNELNHQIDRFSGFYDEIINKNINNIKNLSQKRDSIYTSLDASVQSENQFFQNYKKYTLGGLKLSLGYPSQKIKEELLAGKKVLYHNPAYMDLISALFQNYFRDLFSEYGYEVHYILNNLQSYSRLDSLIRLDTVFRNNPQLKELVMLKGLHDAFYDKNFSVKAVTHILDSMQPTVEYPENLMIARNIREGNKKLSSGDKAPEFCLYEADSNRVCLEDLKGSYIYLGFCNSANYSCMRHYNILENLYKNHKQHFKIVIISNTDNFGQMKRFVEHHGYPWTFLHSGNQPDVLKKYRVKNMPAYYFINPEGKLLLSPAPAPSEEIEQKIYNIMKSDGAL